MAAGKEDLSCSICLDPCTEPVSLPCGHRFCRLCISYELDTQKCSEVFFCPQCRMQIEECPPVLHKKMHGEETVPCTYCDDSSPAEKTCLLCDASLCAKHLTKHSSAPEHVLIEPTASPEDRKCTEHRRVLDHYCIADNVFLCWPCYKTGDHKGHEVISLNIDPAEKKRHLIPLIKELRLESKRIETQIHSLQDHEATQIRNTDAVSEQVTGQIQNVQTKLEDLHNKVLNEVYAQKRNILESVLDWKKKLEEQRQELSEKISDMEELCNVRDPLTFLKKVMGTDLIGIFNVEHSTVSADMLDETPILEMLHKELLQFADGLINRLLKDAFPKMKKSEISLDINTAHCKIKIRRNSRMASFSVNRQLRRGGPERFRSQHVLSRCNFSSGHHYWEVEVTGTQCSIGVAYNNIERKTIGRSSRIVYNRRSWGLSVDNDLSVWHNFAKTNIPTGSPVRSFGIFLEYEAGRLSFYQICDPIRQLHTFSTTFTRPLHAAFYLGEGSRIKILK